MSYGGGEVREVIGRSATKVAGQTGSQRRLLREAQSVGMETAARGSARQNPTNTA